MIPINQPNKPGRYDGRPNERGRAKSTGTYAEEMITQYEPKCRQIMASKKSVVQPMRVTGT